LWDALGTYDGRLLVHVAEASRVLVYDNGKEKNSLISRYAIGLNNNSAFSCTCAIMERYIDV
jgi:hypothetical protein